MIAMWMLRFLVATALVALAARAAEGAARGLGWPRRWIWAGAFLLVVVLPWVGVLLPTLSLVDGLIDRLSGTAAVGVAVLPADVAAVAATASSETPRALFDVVLLGAWAAASLALAFIFGRGLRRVRTALRRGDAFHVEGVDVLRCASLGPATVGALRPMIVLPRWVEELPAAECALIVSHEQEHATARDPLLLMAAALIVVAAPWCLPLWWMHRRLRDAAETDCDARVLARGADCIVYGRALLRAAARPPSATIRFAAPLLGGLDVTRLERRILMMTQRRTRHPVLRAVPLIAVAAVAGVVACDAAGDAVGMPDRAPPPTEVDTTAATRAQRVSEEYFFETPLPVTANDDAETYEQARDLYEHARVITRLRNSGIEADTAGGGSASGERSPGAAQDAFERAVTGAERAAVAPRRGEDRSSEAGVLRPRNDRASDGPAQDEPVFYIDDERVGRAALGRLDPATIERIEVIKGARTALFGPGHAAGVVTIYTKNR